MGRDPTVATGGLLLRGLGRTETPLRMLNSSTDFAGQSRQSNHDLTERNPPNSLAFFKPRLSGTIGGGVNLEFRLSLLRGE